MSKGVQVVVGEFELLERDELAAPVRPGGRGVRVDVEPPGHRGLCLSRYRPLDREEAADQTRCIQGVTVICLTGWRPSLQKAYLVL